MPDTGLVPNLLCGLAAMAVVGSAAAAPAVEDAKLRVDLETIARRTIYFGHKSVGANIVEGLVDLASQAGVPLRVTEVDGALGLAPGTFGHGPVAENRNPLLKLESFTRILDSGPPSAVDIAFVKFCFVDFDSGTDASALFARYQATIAALRAKHPGTSFVHVTVPLTTVERGVKSFVKRLLGGSVYGLAENARRDEYNALLRKAYAGREPVFDLASVESTAPDGKPEAIDWQGRSVPALVDAYTDDGGHLNREGRLRAARELVSVLASIPDRRLAGGSIGSK
jgi:hypothetical protein